MARERYPVGIVGDGDQVHTFEPNADPVPLRTISSLVSSAMYLATQVVTGSPQLSPRTSVIIAHPVQGRDF